ncbi:nucleolar protein 10 [Ananas comosus]|uniref:Nucleolar protein 10 n=1 Tax=Ananas comosus TaxID=4615 RepID=A0A6P5GW39_ANACO|nr:nucleolar protein 10 [Ananas comosus]XP_020112877.1 nucleolar protein 10 [Ananas comosus]
MAGRGESIKSTSINGVKLYSLSGQRSTATWLTPKKQRALRKDKGYQQRVDLIQDLSFETATTKIKATPNGEYVIASGIYPPQVKVYELKQLSMKFERHLISEIINFQVLDEDYSKIAFLCSDRSVCLHAKYGSHYSLRLPRMGRDIAYDCWSCDLLCAASSPDLYRINLEQGRFLSSLTSQSPAINVVSRSNIHGLVACGGEDGAVECFDMRKKSSVGRISTAASPDDIGQEVTALQFDESQGYLMAAGSSTGKISIYDLRMSNPIRVKDHMYGSPILGIKWHQTLNFTEPKLITADSHIVRIWDPNTGENMTSIEPTTGSINDICIFKNSGLMLLALDSSQIPAYFIPGLGPAPKWCSYLENITEEMEENSQTTIYDDYKFLTTEDLERLNLTDLIGTNLLRAYMHGYFIDYRLYKKAQALADPFAYEVYREKQKQEKMKAERDSRITLKRKLPKVNRDLAARLLKEQEAEDREGENADDENMTKKKKKNKGISSDILKDERFAILFENKDFEIDEESQEYLSLHPQSSMKQRSLIEEHFEPVKEDEEQSNSDASMDSQTMEDDSDNDNNELKNSRRMRLYEVKDERHAEAFLNHESLAKEDALPLGERVALLNERQPTGGLNGVKFGAGGSREISFLSRSSKKQQYRDEEGPKEAKRRGVQSLGLKPSKAEFYAMGGRGGRGKSRGKRGRR